jgi:hypothetical protein
MEHPHIEDDGQKQLAQIRGQKPRERPYWVYDPDDWEKIRALSRGMLTCPEPGCPVSFQKPRSNHKGTRWLARMAEANCSHADSRPASLGGQVSPQHRWLQARIVRICDVLNYRAEPEHKPTNSDIYLPTHRLSIEVQRWNTKFDDRTNARFDAGAHRVLWLLTEDAKGKRAERALFRHPSARLRVHHMNDRNQILTPWDNPAEHPVARLLVYGTVAALNSDDMTLQNRRYDLMKFLKEIVDDERAWYPPGTRGLAWPTSGAWVRHDDYDTVRRHLTERKKTATSRQNIAHTSEPAPTQTAQPPHQVRSAPSPAPPSAPQHNIASSPRASTRPVPQPTTLRDRGKPAQPESLWEQVWTWIKGAD